VRTAALSTAVGTEAPSAQRTLRQPRVRWADRRVSSTSWKRDRDS
jgi:hypothetical protein